MEFRHQLAGFVRSNLFSCKSREKNASLDPMVRSALVETVQQDRENWKFDLETIQAELDHVSSAWQQSKDREQFLDTRIRKYRKVLRERSKDLSETPHEPDYEHRRLQFHRDDEALQKIQETHKLILVQCESMRRKLQDLERKRDMMVRMDEQLHVFVEASNHPHLQPVRDPATSPSQPAEEQPDPEQYNGEQNRDLEGSTMEQISACTINRDLSPCHTVHTGEGQIKMEETISINEDPPQMKEP